MFFMGQAVLLISASLRRTLQRSVRCSATGIEVYSDRKE
jgi:hypothetical protein